TSFFANNVVDSVFRQSTDSADRAHKRSEAKDFITDELGTGRPLGQLVGLIERQLYIYALLRGVPDIIVATLLFKAFQLWLEARYLRLPFEERLLLSSGKRTLCISHYYC